MKPLKKADKTWTVIDIVRWGSDYFKEKEIDSPRLTIELMLCEVLDINRIDIYTQFEKPLTQLELDRLREMVSRRVKHEPLQYIIGKTNFYGLTILLDKNVLIPRPETEMLVDILLKDTGDKERKYKILDIGSGSGCISVAIGSHLPNADVTALDSSEEALLLTEKNAELNAVKNIKYLKCNILQDFPSEKKFDIIVSNPPYISLRDYNELEPEVLKYEPEAALTDRGDGLTFYRRLSHIFKYITAPGGLMYLEFGYGQAEEINAINEAAGLKSEIYKDLSGIERVAKISGRE
jgi:release factor glutamine methyltransferase